MPRKKATPSRGRALYAKPRETRSVFYAEAARLLSGQSNGLLDFAGPPVFLSQGTIQEGVSMRR